MVKIQANKSLEYLLTEAAVIRSAMASEPAVNSDSARRYKTWSTELQEVQDQINKRLRMIQFDD